MHTEDKRGMEYGGKLRRIMMKLRTLERDAILYEGF
jgi:hypothetical protein